jgi:hypothetical protein
VVGTCQRGGGSGLPRTIRGARTVRAFCTSRPRVSMPPQPCGRPCLGRKRSGGHNCKSKERPIAPTLFYYDSYASSCGLLLGCESQRNTQFGASHSPSARCNFVQLFATEPATPFSACAHFSCSHVSLPSAFLLIDLSLSDSRNRYPFANGSWCRRQSVSRFVRRASAIKNQV